MNPQVVRRDEARQDLLDHFVFIGQDSTFYRPIEDGIEVLRVLHGARDIPRILGQ